jgi:hypothetical protein
MAYAHKVIRVSIFGQSCGGAEEWQTGFFLADEGADIAPPDAACNVAIMSAWQTFFTSANTHISNQYNCLGVKSALILTDTKSDRSHIETGYYTTALQGGEGGGALPPQLSLVASLNSSIPRGPAAKGRMYLPGIRLAIDGTTGKISPTEQNQIKANLATFFNAVNASSDIPGKVALVSEGRVALFGGVDPLNKYVTRVKVGNIYDTQRRRRNQLVETYVSQDLA